jgi:hypothetical protein
MMIVRHFIRLLFGREIMSAELMLESTEPSLLIIEERSRKDIVIGIPHHAPAGKMSLPCSEHKESDENAGFLGRYLAEKIDCCSIIACNYPVDVNKFFRSDYTMQIAHWNPKVLIEIHGHGGTKAKSDIEISSGSSNEDRFSSVLAEKLRNVLSTLEDLRDISICGEYKSLYFKAGGAVTISDGRWIAYHIELPPELRKTSSRPNGKPPQAGYRFCDALANVLMNLHGDGC